MRNRRNPKRHKKQKTKFCVRDGISLPLKISEVDEVEEEPKEEEPKETEPTEIEKIREEINELYKLVDSILEKIGESRKEADERFSKLEQMSAAKPAAEEFEQLTASKKTGDNKLDKFLSNYGK